MSAIAAAPVAAETIADIAVDLIDIGTNVRVDPTELEGLAASIKSEGLAQPVQIVGPHADGRYRLVYGQRRLLASRLAELPTIRAIVVAESDVDEPGPRRSILQLAENLQRADLNSIEEAIAIKEVLDSQPGLTQATLAEKLGRSPSWIANTLGLLEAPAPIQGSIRTGQLSAAHAKALKGLAPKTQVEIAKQAIEHGFSAHRTEEEVQRLKRTEEYRKEREAAERAEAEKRRQQNEAAIANFEKREVAKDARIIVEKGYYGDGKAGHVADLIRKAGYTNVELAERVAAKPAGVACDCGVWRVAISWGSKITLGQGCVSKVHQGAREDASNAKRIAKERRMAEVQAMVAERLPGLLAEATLPPLAGRIILWLTLDYGVAEWAEKHGGKRSQPWGAVASLPDDEIPGEVAKALARGFRDRYGYHIDWDALAATLDQPSAEPGSADSPSPVVPGTEEPDRGADSPMCTCGKPKVQAGADRWVCTNPDHSPKAATA